MHTDLHSTVGQLGLWMLEGQFNFSNATDCYLNEQHSILESLLIGLYCKT